MKEQLCNKDILIKDLYKIIKRMKTKIIQLEEEIHILKKPKNSYTGSVPPSKDENRVTKSLREKTGRKPGGQKGHQGHTLKISTSPDLVMTHKHSFCQECGKDIRDIEGILRQKRQVLDIPKVSPVYTEHQCYSRVCCCGHINTSKFPDHVNARMQYGTNVEALISYMSTRQYMSYERTSECFKDVYGLPISQGSVQNLLERFANKAALVYGKIQKNVF